MDQKIRILALELGTEIINNLELCDIKNIDELISLCVIIVLEVYYDKKNNNGTLNVVDINAITFNILKPINDMLFNKFKSGLFSERINNELNNFNSIESRIIRITRVNEISFNTIKTIAAIKGKKRCCFW